jgi:hypothetical protein
VAVDSAAEVAFMVEADFTAEAASMAEAEVTVVDTGNPLLERVPTAGGIELPAVLFCCS